MIDVMTPGMVGFDREEVLAMEKITVSLPSPLLAVLDGLARKWSTTRSDAVAELIRRVEQEELEEQLKEGYLALAEANRKDAGFFLHAQAEVVLRDGN
ncbi:CopG family ribbon-helix-helix protein [Desulfofundulus salinus]|uniref:CopG family transcriptional regulator n=1 Tax=Desulfofundulus salinus TaxID=2419843 RepID=A0A494WYA0_9FIRM|nr:ribbon-helix-helix domain-containing protein [Desulfofundulus salinum]RKO68111.1 CopG family transcriptional regulator [Desulfofundulus salinum]